MHLLEVVVEPKVVPLRDQVTRQVVPINTTGKVFY